MTNFCSTASLLLFTVAAAVLVQVHGQLPDIDTDKISTYKVVPDGVTFPLTCSDQPQDISFAKQKDPKTLKVTIPCRPNLDEFVLATGPVTLAVDDAVNGWKQCTRILKVPVSGSKPSLEHKDFQANNPSEDFVYRDEKYNKTTGDGAQLFQQGAADTSAVWALDPKCNFSVKGVGAIGRRFNNMNKNACVIDKDKENIEDLQCLPSVLSYSPLHEFTVDYVSGETQSWLGDGSGWDLPKTEFQIPCGERCYRAKHVFFKSPRGQTVKFSVGIKNTCQSVQICIDATETFGCRAKHILHVFPRHGLVIMPHYTRAVPMKFFRPGQDMTVFHIERGASGHIYLTSPFRARTRSALSNNGDFLIKYSGDCHVTGLGVHWPGNNGMAMAETATEKSEIEKESKDAEISTTPPNIVTVSEETEKTTTPPIDIHATVVATTTVPLALAPAAVNDGIFHVPVKGWAIWGHFVGFAAGLVLSLVIASIILFVMRRSIYSDWYRAMYKRYGQDASAMTGQTSVSAMAPSGVETVGSTMAGTTAAGGTTMGTTTGGTTMGTTAGTTTGSPTEGGASQMGTTAGGKTDMVTM